MRFPSRALFAVAAALLGTAAWAAPAGPAFTVQPPIAAPDGKWDFASWDEAHHRLLVAHGKDVLLIDPAVPGAVRAIGTIENAHAALAIPGTDRILVSSGRDDSVRILDAASGAEVARIAVAADPDAAVLSADGHNAYVMDSKAGVVSVVDLDHFTETGRIMLKPALEVAVLAGPKLLAVNNEEANEIELADLMTGKAAGSIALAGCEGPTGLAYAPESGLALSACANGKAALVDISQRKLVRLLPIGMGPDTAIWDAAHHRFLVPCGKSGTLSVIQMDRSGASVAPQIRTEISARTAALDSTSGRLYLPAARFQPAEQGKKPAIVPGSFHIAVLAPAD